MKRHVKLCLRTRFVRLLLSFFLFSFFTSARAQTVSGTVTDESGKSLVGVSVAVKGASSGTTTDAQGRYRLETVVPGLYPGRTRHIHVKVQAPNGPVLTTQLYFAGEARNAGDGIFRQELLMQDHGQSGGTRQTGFTFVVATGA